MGPCGVPHPTQALLGVQAQAGSRSGLIGPATRLPPSVMPSSFLAEQRFPHLFPHFLFPHSSSARPRRPQESAGVPPLTKYFPRYESIFQVCPPLWKALLDLRFLLPRSVN